MGPGDHDQARQAAFAGFGLEDGVHNNDFRSLSARHANTHNSESRLDIAAAHETVGTKY